MLRAGHITLEDGALRVEPVEEDTVRGPIDFAVERLTRATTVLGGGPLARSGVPGSNRLVLCGHSPAWDGFYVSTVGSAAAPLFALGLDVLSLHGRASVPSALVLSRAGGSLQTRLFPVPVPDVFRSEARGTWGVLRFVRDRLTNPNGRVLAIGPAALNTNMGALASASPVGIASGVIDTWAGRGGFGSRLFAVHNLVAVAFDEEPVRAEPSSLPAEVLKATQKYRYHPLLKTGGTLGSNLTTLKEKLLAFNGRTVALDAEARERLYDVHVRQRYLKQHNESLRDPGASKDCGETCPAVCKKVARPDGKTGHKKDFQPYAALGPNIGVFDQREAERVNALADALGFDSIDVGGAVALALELASEGRPLEGTPPVAFDALRFDEADSKTNRIAAFAVIERMAEGRSPLSRGVRAFAESDPFARERALYVANGERGGVSPNQYWCPGILAPVAVSGKYYVDYAFDFRPPRELGRSCARRFTRELAMDNLGLCRFQREWAEEKLAELVGDGTTQEALDAHHRALARRIDSSANPRPFTTRRALQFLHGYLREVQADGPKDTELDAWVARFDEDPVQAAAAYWTELRRGIEEGLT